MSTSSLYFTLRDYNPALPRDLYDAARQSGDRWKVIGLLAEELELTTAITVEYWGRCQVLRNSQAIIGAEDPLDPSPDGRLLLVSLSGDPDFVTEKSELRTASLDECKCRLLDYCRSWDARLLLWTVIRPPRPQGTSTEPTLHRRPGWPLTV